MFAVQMPPPIFSFGHAHDASALYRPAVSSPLSSSPIRGSSPSPTKPRFGGSNSQIMSSPLSARDPNTCALPRVQSSPISGFEENGKKKTSIFKYANRDTRPNPVAKKREDKQETRRRLFLQNVRQRADDKKWERRGGENELLKLEWSRLNRELRQAKESDLQGFVLEDEIEDQFQLYQDVAQQQEDPDLDAMMLDEIEQQEQAEIEELLSTLPTSTAAANSQTRPSSPTPTTYSDDDYDAIFMDLISSQTEQSDQLVASQQDVEMSF
ncbi:hypothetical protein V8F20_007020 [Naviculisporaceae sp. PSN 640]